VRLLMAGVCPPEQTIEPPQRKETIIMSKFTVHTIESAPEGSKPALQKLKASVGLIPNLAAVMANAPALIEVFVTARAAYQNSSLSAIEREVVSITNAVANNCAYCVAAHSTFAQMADTPPVALAALRAGKSPADPRLKALSDFSRKLTTARGQMQRCVCGAPNPKTLSQRWHHCQSCGLSVPRDHASALEILRLGLSLLAERGLLSLSKITSILILRHLTC
jgi:uncharacterized peroxidase-related enzyme